MKTTGSGWKFEFIGTQLTRFGTENFINSFNGVSTTHFQGNPPSTTFLSFILRGPR